MMQKLSGIAFHDSVDIVDPQLTFVKKKPIRWWFAFEKRDRSFDTPNSSDQRSYQESDDTQMRDQKGNMMFAPRPTRKRGTGEVCSQQEQPKIEPRSPVNIGASDLRIEAGFIERSSDCRDSGL